MKDQIEEFRAYRAKMNERILAADNLEKCYEQGVTTPELFEVFAVADVVGGTIVIPHLRRAVEYWELLQAQTGPEVENEK